MTDVLIALGSNLGDRLANLYAAIDALAPDVTVTARSKIYETDPRYVTDQPRFLNMALAATTALEPAALLRLLKGIEDRLGRKPGLRFGPRLIDLDIVFHGNGIVETPDLQIPHPRLAERAFVLRPLADIAPDWAHLATGLTIRAMLEALDDDGGLREYRPEG